MTDRAAYSRVYWSIIDDPKFANVYDDDRALAAWLRLLLVADQAWPASAHIPTGTNAKALAILVGAGLVDVGTGRRYRIHGLDKERTARSDTGRNAAAVRWHSERTRSSDAHPVQDETRRDETSKDETSESRPPVMTVIDYIEERTGRPYSFGAGSKVHETLSADVRDFGATPVLGAMQADSTRHPDIGQLVFRASRLLHPIGSPNGADPDPDYVKEQLAVRRKARSANA